MDKYCNLKLLGRAVASAFGTLLVGLALPSAQAQAPAPATATGEPIKIGIMAALSGSISVYGIYLADGVKMAAKEVNDQGGLLVKGVRHPIQIIERDTRSDVNTSVAVATSLVRDQGVKYIIGPATGYEIASAMEITQRAKVIHMSAAAVLQTVLTKESVQPGANKSHLFMLQTPSPKREILTVKMSMKYLGNPMRQAVMISNDSNGDFIGKNIEGAMQQSGVTIALPKVQYQPGTTDYSPYLTKIRDAKPDLLSVWWLPSDSINILQQGLQLGAAKSYFTFGPEPLDVLQRIPNADRVLIACSPLCRMSTTTPEAKAFWDRYVKFVGGTTKFGGAAGSAAWYYEGTRMLFTAIQSAGTISNTDEVAAALAKTRLAGALGVMSFDERHLAGSGFDFCLLSKGKQTCEFVTP